MIFRLLALFLIIWFLIWLVKKQLSSSGENRSLPDDSEDMLSCKICGTHVPESRGIYKGENFYCCQEHAEEDNGTE